MKLGNASGGKEPWYKGNARSGENLVIDKSLPTPIDKVQRLQRALHVKAKAEPSYRFYTLWDKVCWMDVLRKAYRRCQVNGGSHGIDHETFEDIKNQGLEEWLGKLQGELKDKTYSPKPLRRVWIPKSNGKDLRPLSIACIRDRVVHQAILMIIGPIFEADLLPEQYGFRAKIDAKMAVRRVYYHITQHCRTEVVDADLKDYFNRIPHGSLMKCLVRRIADKQILQTIKSALTVPVAEEGQRHVTIRTEAKDTHRGIAQGSPLSPLLSNCYFRRFLMAWKKFGYERKYNAYAVNYADDFVICCQPNTAAKVQETMENLMGRIGLEVNKDKTHIANIAKGESFDFLGYTVGTFYGKDGIPYRGTRPSKKALKKVLLKIKEETSRRWLPSTEEMRVTEMNSILRGWCGYFNQGPVLKSYEILRKYTEKRFRRWLVKKHKFRGTTGCRQYPDEYLYGKLGLYKIATVMADVPRAKT
ncbi:MAG: group II intron reverse transcriptase/maturase [Alphaproteobacteria bacterium]|nr:group II intron reverse transcriptase/maturase [Alphaproteobacteria bacterium]